MAGPILTTTLLNATRRTCPRCGGKQSVSVFAAQQPVTCRRCGASIPPPPATGAAPGAKPDKPAGRRR